jgi:hypothetical protein
MASYVNTKIIKLFTPKKIYGWFNIYLMIIYILNNNIYK